MVCLAYAWRRYYVLCILELVFNENKITDYTEYIHSVL